MTSASFNPIQTQTSVNTTQQPLTLKQGQVFHGAIKQLYPDQMAEVQVGGQRLFAKLETPLKVGDAHYFQVTNMNPQPELKVVTGPMQQGVTQTQQMQQLMETMNLPKSLEMQQVLSHFIKEQLPISKDQLVAAEQWLKNLSTAMTKQGALEALQRMVELKMPFTKDVFNALLQGQKTAGMTTTLDTFVQLLLKDATLSPDLRNSLLQQLQSLAKPFDAETGGLMLARLLQTITNPTTAQSEKLQALNLLKEMGILPQQANIQNALSTAFQSISQVQAPTNMQQAGQLVQAISARQPETVPQLTEQLKSWINSQGLLTNEQKEQLVQLVQRFSQLPLNKQTIEAFTKQLHEQLIKAFANQASQHLFAKDMNGLSVKDHLLSLLQIDNSKQEMLMKNITKIGNESSQPFIQQLFSDVEHQVQSAVDGKAIEQAMKTILKGLGVSYEAALSNSASDAQEMAHQLKPQLLNVLHDAQASPQLRESAEVLLARLNGMQLLSGENGHQHQLIMQVPLEFFGRKMDATLQWNGRMKEDGKIDAAYARVLFYLQMESMQETVIDMHVQNRIVTVTVYNKNSNQLVQMAEPLKKALKAGLAEKEYQLSGVLIKPFEQPSEQKQPKPSQESTESQGGVDIRI